MKTKSQEVIEKAGIPMRLSLAEKVVENGKPKGTRSTGKHTVKFLEDKVVKGKDFMTGEERFEMKYIFEENGQKKFYTKAMRDENGEVSYFVQKMSQFNYGDELTLEYVPKGARGYISINKVGEALTPSGEQIEEREMPEKDDIPIVEEEDVLRDEEDIDPADIPF